MSTISEKKKKIQFWHIYGITECKASLTLSLIEKYHKEIKTLK